MTARSLYHKAKEIAIAARDILCAALSLNAVLSVWAVVSAASGRYTPDWMVASVIVSCAAVTIIAGYGVHMAVVAAARAIARPRRLGVIDRSTICRILAKDGRA